MKTSKLIIVALAVTILLTAATPCLAGQAKQENIWTEDKPTPRAKQPELTDEMIERIMERLQKIKPEKAEQLTLLREKSQEEFRAELRKTMREQFGKGRRQRSRQTSRRRRMSEDMPSMGRGGPGERGSMRRKEMMMHERYAEYLEWLTKNYPEEAEKLAELKNENPGLYNKRLAHSLKKYGKIAEAARENPQLADVFKENIELKDKRNKLLKKIRAAGNDAEKKDLSAELEELVSRRFDLIVKRKQIEYEQLRQKLQKLQKQVERREAEVANWKSLKDEKVKARLKELLSQTGKFNWD